MAFVNNWQVTATEKIILNILFIIYKNEILNVFLKILSKKHAIVVAANKTSKVLDGNVIENFLTKNPGKLLRYLCISCSLNQDITYLLVVFFRKYLNIGLFAYCVYLN